MAGRLINWPLGLNANFREPISGPRTVNPGATNSIGNFVQTTSSPFGLWRWQFSFPPIRGQMFRRYRGWITALHGGANATRVPFCDWDGMKLSQMGVNADPFTWQAGQPWGNGQPWDNGKNWKLTPPTVYVSASANKGDDVISLQSDYWGRALGMGDLIGFYPSHFGMYMVTDVIDAGTYRIWPPLRKDVEYSADPILCDSATLEPTLAMRLESEDAANAPRSAAFAEGLSVTFVEVPDYTVKTWFTD